MDDILFLCINLERSPGRRARMQAAADEAGFPISFVRAVDGRALDLNEAPGYNRKGRLRHAPDLQPNEVACVLSHKAALETFLASKAHYAVILEDDALLAPHFLDSVQTAIALPVSWHAISLENRNRKPLRPAIVRFESGVALHASAWLSQGAAGWLFAREGAERVHRSLHRFRHAYDTHLGFFWRYGLTALCVHPPAVAQDPGAKSTIAEQGASRAFRESDLTYAQFLRARRERVEHEARKEVSARLTLLRLKAALAVAALSSKAPRS